ncbi:MAG: hypothetical protein K9M15_01390 [Candidatus Marinimicrobia bacterium]|nr:hypothetical protein [Candidatus Neomarinimicrobiota bacterium]
MNNIFKKFWSNNFFVFLLLFVVGFAIYANSFVVPFFWDDNDNVVNNTYVKSWEYFGKYFSENLVAGAGLMSNYWRPFLLITYSLDYNFFGLNKYWWHFVDVSLHVLVAFFLFLILAYLFKRKNFALLISLVFLAHPLQTEAISMITARADPLFFVFFLASIFLYFKRRVVLSLLLFAFALLSKEIAITLPAVLLLIEICFFLKEKLDIKKIFLKVLPFASLAGLYFWARLTILNFSNTLNFYDDASVEVANFGVRILTFFKALLVYFKLMLFPANLHSERLFEPATFFTFSIFASIVLFLFMFVFSLIRFKKNKTYFFGFGWFMIALAPVSGVLIPINRLIYEHWLYVPLIGFFIFLFELLREVFGKFKMPRVVLMFLVLLYLCFFCGATINRNFDWKNPIVFYNNILKYNTQSLLVWNNLGMEYANIGMLEEAEASYREAVILDKESRSAPPHHNLGNLYKEKGLVEEAEIELMKAIEIDKNFYFSYNALADLYLKTGQYDKLKNILRDKLEVYPDDFSAQELLRQIKETE